jgi:hypothetical protein
MMAKILRTLVETAFSRKREEVGGKERWAASGGQQWRTKRTGWREDGCVQEALATGIKQQTAI